ncbi:hypothetical protein F5146DRAFT_1016763, partial [Armillaria mellea]
MYSKSAGKGANHSWVSSIESIGAVSYLVVQTYEHLNQRTFQQVHHQFAPMGLSRIAHLLSNSFLTVVPGDSVFDCRESWGYEGSNQLEYGVEEGTRMLQYISNGGD